MSSSDTGTRKRQADNTEPSIEELENALQNISYACRNAESAYHNQLLILNRIKYDLEEATKEHERLCGIMLRMELDYIAIEHQLSQRLGKKSVSECESEIFVCARTFYEGIIINGDTERPTKHIKIDETMNE